MTSEDSGDQEFVIHQGDVFIGVSIKDGEGMAVAIRQLPDGTAVEIGSATWKEEDRHEAHED